jgi:hypothetical protein
MNDSLLNKYYAQFRNTKCVSGRAGPLGKLLISYIKYVSGRAGPLDKLLIICTKFISGRAGPLGKLLIIYAKCVSGRAGPLGQLVIIRTKCVSGRAEPLGLMFKYYSFNEQLNGPIQTYAPGRIGGSTLVGDRESFRTREHQACKA